jgi:putative salt-induced outer membrane protein YdiY
MRTPSAIMLAALAACGAGLAQAQPADPPKPLWESSASLGLTLTRGNSDTLLFTGDIQTKRKEPQNEYAFGVGGAYGENNKIRNNESLNGFGQWNHLFTDRFYGYLRADGLHDGIADIKYRVTVGPGVGYYFIKAPNTSLSGEVGPGYVFENKGGKTKNYATLRVGERFEQKLSAKARLWQSLDYYPQIDDFKNYFVVGEIGVEAALTAKLSLRTYLQDTYYNKPAPGRKSNDIKLVSGIKYTF